MKAAFSSPSFSERNRARLFVLDFANPALGDCPETYLSRLDSESARAFTVVVSRGSPAEFAYASAQQKEASKGASLGKFSFCQRRSNA